MIKITAGCWEVHNDAVAIRAIIAANATTASEIHFIPKFKDQVIISIHQRA